MRLGNVDGLAAASLRRHRHSGGALDHADDVSAHRLDGSARGGTDDLKEEPVLQKLILTSKQCKQSKSRSSRHKENGVTKTDRHTKEPKLYGSTQKLNINIRHVSRMPFPHLRG